MSRLCLCCDNCNRKHKHTTINMYLQSRETSCLWVLQVEGVGKNMDATVLSEDNRPLPSRTHLTVEAAYTCLSHDAVELRLFWILSTDVADLRLGVIRDEARLISQYWTTTLRNINTIMNTKIHILKYSNYSLAELITPTFNNTLYKTNTNTTIISILHKIPINAHHSPNPA